MGNAKKTRVILFFAVLNTILFFCLFCTCWLSCLTLETELITTKNWKSERKQKWWRNFRNSVSVIFCYYVCFIIIVFYLLSYNFLCFNQCSCMSFCSANDEKCYGNKVIDWQLLWLGMSWSSFFWSDSSVEHLASIIGVLFHKTF